MVKIRPSYLDPDEPSPRPKGQPKGRAKRALEFGAGEPQGEANKQHISIFLRLKPDDGRSETPICQMVDGNSLLMTAPDLLSKPVQAQYSHKFTFTRIFDSDATQEEVFEGSVLSCVQMFVNGHNHLVFSYGTTNAGKTHTIQGSPCDGGVLPRTLDLIFSHIQNQMSESPKWKPLNFASAVELSEEQRVKEDLTKKTVRQMRRTLYERATKKDDKAITSASDTGSDLYTSSSVELDNLSRFAEGGLDDSTRCPSTMKKKLLAPKLSWEKEKDVVFSAWVSFAEIYTENIYDLLVLLPEGKIRLHPLKLAEGKQGKVYIKGLTEVHVTSTDEALEVLKAGTANLHFAATKLNRKSSRSHCIFTIKLTRTKGRNTRVSVLSFCDLAGMERVGKTGNVGLHLKEAGNINTSLMVLGRCISALRTQASQKALKSLVPFRDSKLTRLFQNFFVGGRVTMIVNLSQSPGLYEESLSVLKFSAVAKEVVTSYSQKQQERKRKRSCRLSQILHEVNEARGSVQWAHQSKVSDTSLDSFLQEDNEPGEDYENYVKELQDMIIKERHEKRELEMKLRNELVNEFDQYFNKCESSWREKLQEAVRLNEDLAESRIRVLNNCLEKERRRMRRHDKSENFVPRTVYDEEVMKFQAKEKEVQDLTKALEECQSELKNLEVKSVQQKETTAVMESQVSHLQKLNDDLHKLMTDSTSVPQEMPQESAGTDILKKDEEITKLRRIQQGLQEVCIDFDEELCESTDLIVGLQQAIVDKEDTIHDLKNQLSIQAAELEQAKARESVNDKRRRAMRRRLRRSKLKTQTSQVEDITVVEEDAELQELKGSLQEANRILENVEFECHTVELDKERFASGMKEANEKLEMTEKEMASIRRSNKGFEKIRTKLMRAKRDIFHMRKQKNVTNCLMQDKDAEIAALKHELMSMKISTIDKELEEQTKDRIQELRRLIGQYESKLQLIKSKLPHRDSASDQQDSELDKMVIQLESTLKDFESEIHHLNKLNPEKNDRHSVELEASMKCEIARIRSEVAEALQQIQEMKEVTNDLEEEK